MRKVLHIITGLKNGGAEAILYRIISDNCQNFQHEVISLSDKGYYGVLLTTAGIKITTLNISSFFSIFSRFPKLYILIKSAKPDVVQTWMYHADIIGGIAAKFAGVPKIVWGIHSTFLNPKETKITTMLAVILSKHLSYYIPDKIICCSEVAMSSHIDLGYKSNKMVVINNGIDIKKFSPNLEARLKIRTQLGILDSTILIGMIARWDINKNHKLLFNTLNKFMNKNFKYNCKILLAGDSITNGNNDLIKQLEENNLLDNCFLIGSVDNIEEHINALDLHVLTSNSESFGNITAECLACGIEVISTDVGLCNEFTTKGLGQIVPVNNSEILLESFYNFFNNYKINVQNSDRKFLLRKKISESFNQEDMIEKYNKIWNKIYTDERTY